ncbi:hypothetical protein [Paenibacillus shenyangensis]|uniref:hypothetical protein n=1 Tax=Paenibacillus sp. A9 TaxID=1284352 RepID=UPI00036242B1|nr:hypothetical protein [Paenibacillus sp. A9]
MNVGGAIITDSTNSHTDSNRNVVLFPKTLDYYQVELTNMLETERYHEAISLLEFLLQCQGQDQRQLEEWESLLGWLRTTFPESSHDHFEGLDASEDEEPAANNEQIMRERIRLKQSEDRLYEEKLLKTAMERPVSERTLLALEQLSYLDQPDIEQRLIEWLQEEHQIHPLIQFRVLQTLRRRGYRGTVSFMHQHERVDVEVETVPLDPTEFPLTIIQILERVSDKAEISAPNLFYFAQELWTQFIMSIYGTQNYIWITRGDDAEIDIWAAALHQTVAETLEGSSNEEETRNMYGVTDSIRFRYEQAYRAIHQFVSSQMPR